jgi:uncharacterized protein (DUF2384 family)
MTKEETLKYGLTVFNNETDKFERWLEKKNWYLEFPPKELIETEEGLKQVKRLLDIIEYGEYSN